MKKIIILSFNAKFYIAKSNLNKLIYAEYGQRISMCLHIFVKINYQTSKYVILKINLDPNLFFGLFQ